MSKLTIVAHIQANPDAVDLVKSELLKLVEPTLKEEGCLQYDLHQDNDHPTHFMFYENWTTRELWQDHMGSAHLAAFQEATDGAVAELVIHEMTPTS